MIDVIRLKAALEQRDTDDPIVWIQYPIVNLELMWTRFLRLAPTVRHSSRENRMCGQDFVR